MGFRAFKTATLVTRDLLTSDGLLRALNTLQANVGEVLAPMIAATQNDSVILTGVQLAAGGENVVSHKLGRKLAGWKMVRLRGDARVWDAQDTNRQPNLTLLLHVSADVVVDLEVF